MLALGAVEPHGRGGVDHDGEDGDLALGGRCGDGLVARVDALCRGVDVGDGDARVVKGGLDDGVVAAAELELDHGADGRVDLLGEELERVVRRGDGNDLDVDGCRWRVSLLSCFPVPCLSLSLPSRFLA